MLAITQEQLDAVVREAYDHAHACCHYAPTDRSFPVGEDGKMDCTGLMLRSRITWGLSTSTIRTTASAGMAGRFPSMTQDPIPVSMRCSHTSAFRSMSGAGRWSLSTCGFYRKLRTKGSI